MRVSAPCTFIVASISQRWCFLLHILNELLQQGIALLVPAMLAAGQGFNRPLHSGLAQLTQLTGSPEIHMTWCSL